MTTTEAEATGLADALLTYKDYPKLTESGRTAICWNAAIDLFLREYPKDQLKYGKTLVWDFTLLRELDGRKLSRVDLRAFGTDRPYKDNPDSVWVEERITQFLQEKHPDMEIKPFAWFGHKYHSNVTLIQRNHRVVLAWSTAFKAFERLYPRDQWTEHYRCDSWVFIDKLGGCEFRNMAARRLGKEPGNEEVEFVERFITEFLQTVLPPHQIKPHKQPWSVRPREDGGNVVGWGEAWRRFTEFSKKANGTDQSTGFVPHEFRENWWILAESEMGQAELRNITPARLRDDKDSESIFIARTEVLYWARNHDLVIDDALQDDNRYDGYVPFPYRTYKNLDKRVGWAQAWNDFRVDGLHHGKWLEPVAGKPGVVWSLRDYTSNDALDWVELGEIKSRRLRANDPNDKDSQFVRREVLQWAKDHDKYTVDDSIDDNGRHLTWIEAYDLYVAYVDKKCFGLLSKWLNHAVVRTGSALEDPRKLASSNEKHYKELRTEILKSLRSLDPRYDIRDPAQTDDLVVIWPAEVKSTPPPVAEPMEKEEEEPESDSDSSSSSVDAETPPSAPEDDFVRKITWYEAYRMLDDSPPSDIFTYGWLRDGEDRPKLIQVLDVDVDASFDPRNLGTSNGGDQTRKVEQAMIHHYRKETYPKCEIEEWSDVEDLPLSPTLEPFPADDEGEEDADVHEMELQDDEARVHPLIQLGGNETLGSLLTASSQLAEERKRKGEPAKRRTGEQEAMWNIFTGCAAVSLQGRYMAVVPGQYFDKFQTESDHQQPAIEPEIVRGLRDQHVHVVYQQGRHIRSNTKGKIADSWYAVCYWGGLRPKPGTFRRVMDRGDTSMPLKLLSKEARERIRRSREKRRAVAEARKARLQREAAAAPSV